MADRTRQPPNPMLFSMIMFMLAFVQFSVGPNIPSIAIRFGLAETDLGIVFTYQFSGALLILLAGTALVRRFGHGIILTGSVLTFVLASMAVPLAPSVGLLSFALFLLGAASANAQVVIFALVELLYGEQSSRYQNLVGAAFAVGAVLGPAFTGFSAASLGWGGVFWTGAAIGAPLVAWLALTPVRSGTQAIRHEQSTGYGKWFWVLTGALVFYLAGESIVNSWLSTFLKDSLEASQLWQGLSLSVFWIGMAGGRLLNSKLVQMMRLSTLMNVSTAGTVLAIGLAVGLAALLGNVPLTTILFGITGVLMGGMAPSLISSLASMPQGPERLHLFFAFGQLGPILAPYFAGRTADASNFFIAFLLPIPALFVMICLLAVFFSLTNPKERAR